MSILIRGMEMPKSCMDCPCFCEEYFYCRAKESGDIGLGKRPKDCPLIPVPPHGRLIDADALIRELEITEEDDHNGATLLMAVFLEVLKSAPTVIDAEEE